MLAYTTTAAAAVLACAALAAAAQTATVVVSATMHGAGGPVTNTTLTVPLNTLYTNDALDAVSVLYLTGSDGFALDSITCTPHRFANGTGASGLPFTSTDPSRLSTNTVVVGSLECLASKPLPNPGSSSIIASGSVIPHQNSTKPTVIRSFTSMPPKTITSTAVVTGNPGTTSTSAPPTPTSSLPSLNTGAAGNVVLESWMVHGVAAVGMGIAALVL